MLLFLRKFANAKTVFKPSINGQNAPITAKVSVFFKKTLEDRPRSTKL
ncbi:hypothetical protein C8N31_104202 [Sulfitobacter mediterraneus]|uniref:Uncharacterized protein n=1 Tax=Sulfitobacter mediterraneus TaxID=83219 RepID=A0A2T6CFP6_9RHOB|nr:hypothetical protein C8N31_104202 [Sulfitobacter mediterraneus]